MKEQPLPDRRRLVLLSFLMLFLELALIRWLTSNIIYLSYFSNFVLLGSFLGIGIGFLRAESKTNYFSLLPLILTSLIAFVHVSPVTIHCTESRIMYFGCAPSGEPIWITLPVIFLAVALTMIALAQETARSFARFEPLEAYRLDICGSLGGIVAFSFLSLLGTPPVIWGIVTAGVLLFLYHPSYHGMQIIAFIAMVLLLGKESIDPESSWSPYYKVRLFPVDASAYQINVNGVPHQMVMSLARRKKEEPLYFLPYQQIKSNPLRNVLIIGAGNGSDVAIALSAGARHVDAVEIDPRIAQIGERINPEHPYQDQRVTLHINDGRAFLEQTRARYDLILFALPDSLALVSGQSSLRLESYLFTREAVQAARVHLTPTGAFGMYNYYRQEWLLDRLAGTLAMEYGHQPCVNSMPGSGKFALLLIGSREKDIACVGGIQPSAQSIPASVDDDHPFPYLRTPSIPPLYLITIAAILLVSYLAIRSTGGTIAQMASYGDMFFMGAAFMLLETKNVVQFALLFGTTWLVNALVFFGVLFSIFIALEISHRVTFRNSFPLYIALFTTIAAAWIVSPESMLSLNAPLRFAVAAPLAFTPLLFANLIFAERFRRVGSSTAAFAANVLGAMVGGLLEYGSLIVGYRALLPILALLYVCAFIIGNRRRFCIFPPTGSSGLLVVDQCMERNRESA